MERGTTRGRRPEFEAYDRADLPSLRDDLVVLYLHGGGYFFGSPQTHRQLALNMAKHCDAPVFSLDYRLAPMHRFPAALDDAIAAYQWLVKTYPQRHFMIAGDSAGGGLAINTALEARSHGLPRPAAVITFSPWTDMAVTGELLDSNNRSCAMLTAKGVREAAQYYLGNADPRDPRHSPLYADLTGLPPQLISRAPTRSCATIQPASLPRRGSKASRWNCTSCAACRTSGRSSRAWCRRGARAYGRCNRSWCGRCRPRNHEPRDEPEALHPLPLGRLELQATPSKVCANSGTSGLPDRAEFA